MTARDKTPSPSSTTARGASAEAYVRDWLAARGYRIIDRNVRNAGGELDIVAWHGGTLCFIEVRSTLNYDHGGPLATVGYRKQARVARAARCYLMRHLDPPPVRFDVVGVTTSPFSIELVEGAFIAPG